MIKKYRKRPVVVEAIQFTNENLAQCAEWLGDNLIVDIVPTALRDRTVLASKNYRIKILGGIYDLDFGDYIVKSLKDGFYIYEEEIFKMLYEVDNERKTT